MRIPAIGFDPPVGMPGGVLPATAAMAAPKTAVSPDGRNRRARSRPDPVPPPPAEPAAAAEETGRPAADHEPLPVYYPPLSQQRAVLDRLAPLRPVPREHVPHQPAAPRTSLDETLWRVMGTA